MQDLTATQTIPQESPDTRVVTFTGPMTIENGSAIKAELTSALDGKTVIVNLNDVTEIDVIGLQFLCSLHRTAIFMGKSVFLAHPTSEVVKKAEMSAGFCRHSGCAGDVERSCLWALWQSAQNSSGSHTDSGGASA